MADASWASDVDLNFWLKVSNPSPDKQAAIAACVAAAADWISDQRPDLMFGGYFEPTDRMYAALRLAAARLFARVDSPNGVVAFDELGAGSILATDPDIARMLGQVRVPAVG